jgi:hypothetical protein
VYTQVRQVQSDRWLQVEAKHGKISHYFDAFGQIKPQYRRDVPPAKMTLNTKGWLLLIVAVVATIWWIW